MGRFIVSRNALGVRFLLESDKGRTLAVSKEYATLDAAKKGICSLVYYAPIAPLVDVGAGEHAPNPKFEIFKENDTFAYALKSANGKSVITAAGFATRKACLRAVSMLRTGVLGAEVVFSNPAGLTPLTVGGMVRDPAPAQRQAVAEPVSVIDVALPEIESFDEMADEPLPQIDAEPPVIEDFASIPAEISLAPHATDAPLPAPEPEAVRVAPSAPRVPRRVTLKGEEGLSIHKVSEAQRKAAVPQGKGRKSGILSKFFKR